MRVLAPAKINLHLRVGPTRGDGFHPLLTWMVTAGLFDTLTFVRRSHSGSGAASNAPSESVQGEPIISLSSDHPSLPKGEENMVVRVATALAGTRNRDGKIPVLRREGVSAFLIKRIPPGAGLAGGSSDAVATLVALNRIWKLNLPDEELVRIANQFGSDLAFFFAAPSAVCTGRGEIVRKLAAPATKYAVLVLPNFEMPTPAAYRRFDELQLGRDEAIRDEPDWNDWSKLDATALLPRLVNDLEPAAFSLKPELSEMRELLEKKLARIVRMSGSGSSLFTLCDEADEATSLAKRASDATNVNALAVQLAPQVDELGSEDADRAESRSSGS